MAQQIDSELLRAIKDDDRKTFDALMDRTQCASYRFGRFPVLSLLYLYNSKKILAAYELEFVKATGSIVLDEPMELSVKFSKRAGKCMRLYYSETVSPLEMLMILNRTKRLKKLYPLATPTSAVKDRLKSIYYIRYGLGVRFDGGGIIIDRRPLTRIERQRLVALCLCVAFALAIIIGAPITVSVVTPDRIDKHIQLSSTQEYVLKKDVVVPENFSADEINCSIDGNGHKLIFRKGAKLGTLNGKLSNLVIESQGGELLECISPSATVTDVTLNVKANLTLETEGSRTLFAATNYGVIDRVTANISGNINAPATIDSEAALGALVQNNVYRTNIYGQTVYMGTVSNCKVNFSHFNLVGEASADALFGGAVAVNNGYVQNCSISGKIIADTFDVAGISAYNYGSIEGCVNNADIEQTSQSDGWNPIACGIVINNSSVVENCVNNGVISAVSSCPKDTSEDSAHTVSAAGIINLNGGSVTGCVNRGNINAKGNNDVYVGGIASRSLSLITGCLSTGDVQAEADNVYAGGILGCSQVTLNGSYVYFGVVSSCISESALKITAAQQGYVGGIAGEISQLAIPQQRYENEQLVEYTSYFGGAVTECYFVGQAPQSMFFGNIVGVCGANIYEDNSYSSGVNQFFHFDGNFYVDNSYQGFYRALTAEGELIEIVDKGATADSVENIQNLQSYKDILAQLPQ